MELFPELPTKGFPAKTKDGETVRIVKKQAIGGEKELFTADDGTVYTRSMDAQALQLVKVDDEGEDGKDASWTDGETPDENEQA